MCLPQPCLSTQNSIVTIKHYTTFVFSPPEHRGYNLRMSMNAAEKQALLKKTVDRIGRMANVLSSECDYFVKLVHCAADIEGVEAVFQRI